MQLKNNSYFPQNSINSTINSLNNLVIFQDYKLKHEFELLLHDSENNYNDTFQIKMIKGLRKDLTTVLIRMEI